MKWAGLIDTIEEMGELDNTLVIYMAGDNGSSAEGGLNGLLNEMTFFNAIPEPIEMKLACNRNARQRETLQPLPCGLGARHGHAVSVDQADRQPLWRHSQRTCDLLAQGH